MTPTTFPTTSSEVQAVRLFTDPMWRFLSTCSSCLVRARGDWVDDQETGYKSDYDLLVVVGNEKQNDLTVGDLERKVREIIGDTVTMIVHDIKFINKEIRTGRIFGRTSRTKE